MRKTSKFWSIIGLGLASIAMVFAALGGVASMGNAVEARAADTTYTFTSKSWTATSGGSAANWTSGKDGYAFSNNGIQVTKTYSGANGTSPRSFTNISKIVLTYNTNKSSGAGSAEVKIGTNAAISKDWAYSSGDGTSARYTLQYDYNTPQTGNVKITLNTTTNSIYLVSCAITTTAATQYDIDVTGFSHCSWKAADSTSAAAGPTKTNSSGTTTGYIVPEDGYRRPDSITKTPNNKIEYNPDSGLVTIAADVGSDVTLSATAVKVYFVYVYCGGHGVDYEETLDAGSNPTVTLSPNTGYRVPTASEASTLVSLEDGSATWSYLNGVISITNLQSDLAFSVTMVQETYSITVQTTHATLCTEGDYASDTTTSYGGTPTIYIERENGYDFPAQSSLTITNATLDEYDTGTLAENIAVISLKAVTGPVTVSIACVAHPYQIDYHITGGTKTAGPVTIVHAGSASITVAPSEGYKLPDAVTISGATLDSYDSTTGEIEISNPTSNVSVTVTMVALVRRDITVTIPDGWGTVSGDTYIYEERTASVTVSANDGYALCDSITVSGASHTWNQDTGVIQLSSPTGPVSISGVIRQMNVYGITVNAEGATVTKSQNNIREDQTVTVTLAPEEGYKLPSSVSVTNATSTYNSGTGVVTLSNPTGAVTVDVDMVELTEYSITVTPNNVTVTGPDHIYAERTAEFGVTANLGYFLTNDSVTVTGATPSWNKNTGVLVLSNPTANVSLSVTATLKQLDHIEISGGKRSFTLGESFSFGGTVTAYDNDGASAQIAYGAEGLTFSGYDRLVAGNQTITVKYTKSMKTVSATYDVLVSPVTVDDYYGKITSTDDVTDGQYLIVYETGNVALNAGLTSGGIDVASNTVSVEIDTDRIEASEALDAAEFTIAAMTDGWSIYSSQGYYIYHSGSKNTLDTSSDPQVHTIEYDSESSSILISSGTYYLKYNSASGQTRFRYYSTSTSQSTIQLYKRYTTERELVGMTGALNDPDKRYYEGTSIPKGDFSATLVYNTGATETTEDFVVAEHELVVGTNSITLTYAPNGVSGTINCVVPVTALSVGDAIVINVELIQGDGMVTDYYYAEGVTTWDLSGLTVRRTWDNEALNDEVSLADLVDAGQASISPSVPASNSTSFTVNYSFHDVDIVDNVVNVTVHPDEVTSLSWTKRNQGNPGGTIDCFEGAQLQNSCDSSKWTFTVSWRSGKESDVFTGTANVGTGANDIHLGLYDTSSPAVEGSPLSLSYPFQRSDNGKYIVAFYHGVASTSNKKITITPLLNSINADLPSDEHTVSWNAQSGDLGTGIGKGTITTASADPLLSYSWDYERTLISGDSYTGYNTSCIQIGKNGGVENITFSTDNIPGTIKSVSVECASHGGNHKVGITVGGDTYLEPSATSSWTTVEAKTGNGDSSGEIVISFTDGSRALYIKSITVVTQGAEKTDIANKYLNPQKAIIAYANYFNDQMTGTNVCAAAIGEHPVPVDPDQTDFNTAWTNVTNCYKLLFTDETVADKTIQDYLGEGFTLTLTSEEKETARLMLQYADSEWREGEDANTFYCLERAMETYDVVVTRYGKTAFLSYREPDPAFIVAPFFYKDNQSPLTVTLWIVLGCGLAGLGAIGTAYFISKKKREQSQI